MTTSVRQLWARTRLQLWPGQYWILSFPANTLPLAAEIVAGSPEVFAALVLERDEVAITISDAVWFALEPRGVSFRAAGPYRALTLDLDLDLGISGYLAPAITRLAEGGIPVVTQCGYRKDHLLVRAADADRAMAILEQLIAAAEEIPSSPA